MDINMALIKEELFDIKNIKTENISDMSYPSHQEQVHGIFDPEFVAIKTEKPEDEIDEPDFVDISQIKREVNSAPSNCESSRKKTKSEKMACPQCNRNFRALKQLNRHMWLKHRKEIPNLREQLNMEFFFACDICDVIAVSKSDIRRHKWTHGIVEESDILKCTKCDYKTPDRFCFRNHLNKRHLEKEGHKCKYCQENFTGKHILADHFLNFHKRGFKKGIFNYIIKHCQLCDFRTVKVNVLKEHLLQSHEKETIPKLKCFDCGFETHWKKTLIIHMDKHNKAKRLVCIQCEQNFVTHKGLTRHMWTKHRKEIPDLKKKLNTEFFFSCDNCEYISMSEADMKKHNWKHGIVDESEKIQCTQCDYRTPSKSNLNRHFIVMHLKDSNV